MSKKILVALPYSGRQIGGGLAVLNEQLVAALAKLHHDVKLLTLRLNDGLNPEADKHGLPQASIIAIERKEAMKMGKENKEGKLFLDDGEREELYRLISDEDVIKEAIPLIQGASKSWRPDIIIGHSRFSGPAAVKLQLREFNEARTEYFLHSYPFEGKTLQGYAAYEEKIDGALVEKKIAEEKEWMAQADVVVAMGPLLTLGALHILKLAGKEKPRVHEAIPGVEAKDGKGVDYKAADLSEINILMAARFNAPIKGLEDMILAATQLNQKPDQLPKKVCLKIRGIGPKEYVKGGRSIDNTTVQAWATGVLGHDFPQVEQRPSDRVRVEVGPLTAEIEKEYLAAHAVLAPSYIEHFGLVPFEALGYGLPVLVNRVSGSGLFLGDRSRFGEMGARCVVMDFKPEKDTLEPDDIMGTVAADAFDGRPTAWAKAILELATNLPTRLDEAQQLRSALVSDFTIDHFAKAVAEAADKDYKGRTRQAAKGGVVEA